MEAEIQPKRHIAFQVKCPKLLTDRDQTALFAVHACRVPGMNCQENPSNRSPDIAE
jgi:hypothetical protein